MFKFKYRRIDKETALSPHLGIFHKQIGLFEAVALIVAGTIGAGVLGLPYALSKVGTLIGICYVLLFGALMIGFNLLVGEIAVRTKGDFHLVGLAEKYLGRTGKILMTFLVYLVVFGILDVYIIGVGQSLSAVLGGSAFQWSVVFWFVGTTLIYFGMRIVKVADCFLSLLVLAVIVFIILASAPAVEFVNFKYSNLASLFLPFGVVLFAFSGSGSVLEAHSLLAGDKIKFKKAILIAGVIIMLTYLLFSVVVLGVTGAKTTEIATIGLGNKLGHSVFFFGNIFAALAMCMSFMTIGLQFRHSLCWDYKLAKPLATLIACGVPLLFYLSGLRGFILMIDIVGGVFFTAEMFLIILIYWRAKQKGDLPVSKYKLHHVFLLLAFLILVLLIGGVYSVTKVF